MSVFICLYPCVGADVKALTSLWLLGDEGVTADAKGVVKRWADSSQALSGRHSFEAMSQRQLVTAHK